MSVPVFRFAPSPNGRLHLGHAYSALLNESLARRVNGRLLLRIEDIDAVRATPGNVRGVEDDLAWLGIRFEAPIRRQSEHLASYRIAAERLRREGLIYPCFCSRGAIGAEVEERERRSGTPWPRDPDGTPVYPGTCRDLPAAEVEARIASGLPHAWRIHAAALTEGLGPICWIAFDLAGTEELVSARPERWGDAVVVRKDAPASYHLCVVLDDAVQGVTDVVRGSELTAATDLHAALAMRLGLRRPRYHHHALIRAEDGSKLSKSLGSPSLASMRAAGVTAHDIRRRFGFACAP